MAVCIILLTLFGLFQYLKKLHLQERVVEEVKMAIKPHYAKKDINKDQYKEILRKAVPKVGICYICWFEL